MKAPNNTEQIDSQLATPAQLAVRAAVRALPEDTLSMAWRSGLNERLIAESAKSRKPFRFFAISASTAGLAMAAALVLIVFVKPSPSSPSTRVGKAVVASHAGSVELGILDTYRQESNNHEIVGSGPDPSADSSRSSIVDAASDPLGSESDPDNL